VDVRLDCGCNAEESMHSATDALFHRVLFKLSQVI